MERPLEFGDFWRAPSAPIALSERAIHVWRVALGAGNETVAGLARLLDPEEQGRAERFRTEALRRRFVVRRARLRQILARYAATPPDALRFERGPHGKPRLAPPWRRERIEFSASHSADWALVAVAAGRPVGVDIEQVRPVADVLDLSRNYFAASENEALARLPESERLEVFFQLWVCKEAVLKALGTGLSLGLDQVVVSADAMPPRIEAMGHDQDRAAWRLEYLRAAPGFAAALAWEALETEPGGDPSLERYEFPAERP